MMSVIDIEHAINILIVTDGNNLVIEYARPNRNGVSINDCVMVWPRFRLILRWIFCFQGIQGDASPHWNKYIISALKLNALVTIGYIGIIVD